MVLDVRWAIDAAIAAGQRIAQECVHLDRRERLRIVRVFRAQLIPAGRPGRRRREEITVAYADWKSGVRGLPLYSQHIPGFENFSHWKR